MCEKIDNFDDILYLEVIEVIEEEYQIVLLYILLAKSWEKNWKKTPKINSPANYWFRVLILV
jgi:hypothetical protein